MILLFSLPVEIWQEHVFANLTLTEIVKASTAISNRQIHQQFQHLLLGLTLKPWTSVKSEETEKLCWYIQRNVMPSQLEICDTLDAKTVSILPLLCSRLSVMKLMDTSQNFEPIHCLRLTRLELWGCLLESLGNLCVCPNLTVLMLQDCSNVTTKSLLNSLVGCTKLTECRIEYCRRVGQEVISYMLNNFPTLVSIQVGEIFNRPFDLSAIVEKCSAEPAILPRLHSLMLTYCTVCCVGLQRTAKMFPQLKKLHIHASVSNISDANIELICQAFPRLTDVSFRAQIKLTSASLELVARHLPVIERLSVSSCTNICNTGVIAVAKTCAQLTILDLSYCTNIADAAVREVWQHCVELQKLNVNGCRLVTDAAFCAANQR